MRAPGLASHPCSSGHPSTAPAPSPALLLLITAGLCSAMLCMLDNSGGGSAQAGSSQRALCSLHGVASTAASLVSAVGLKQPPSSLSTRRPSASWSITLRSLLSWRGEAAQARVVAALSSVTETHFPVSACASCCRDVPAHHCVASCGSHRASSSRGGPALPVSRQSGSAAPSAAPAAGTRRTAPGAVQIEPARARPHDSTRSAQVRRRRASPGYITRS